jgi:hypothetical protein
MDLHPDLIDRLMEFASFGVEYLVVGGWAVGIHAEPRYTKDLDILIGTSPENLARVIEAMEAYGAPPALVAEVRTMTSEDFVFFGVPPARVDLLRTVPGVDFERAWSNRTTIEWHGVSVHVIGFDELCDAKRAAGRPKDLADLRMLEKFRA